MILSVSRRTDIPAFFGEWFINRLISGNVMVRNPMNSNQITSIPLSPKNIDCIVFWTKDPTNFLQYLDHIDRMGYKYYFLFTINPYDKEIEENVDFKKNIITTFKTLSNKIGKEKVIWRYDPIILTSKYNLKYHSKWYEYLAKSLSGYTQECVISFLDQYEKIRNNIKDLNILNPNRFAIEQISERLSNISHTYGINISTCAHDFELQKYNINHSKCIDDKLIEKIIGEKIKVRKDSAQRKECGCVESRDIGLYNSCQHYCKYCYANCSIKSVENNIKNYDPDSPLLCDLLRGNESITVYKKSKSLKISKVLQQELI